MEKKEKPPTLFREFFFKLRQIILEEIDIIKVWTPTQDVWYKFIFLTWMT